MPYLPTPTIPLDENGVSGATVVTQLLLTTLLFLVPIAVEATESEMAGGGKVEWARLKTPSPSWQRHAGSDHLLLEFIRDNTSLDIDTAWHAADVDDLHQMCAYPFLFSEGLGYVDEAGRKNLREYIQRGGFLFIDSCIAPDVNPVQANFVSAQMTALRDIVPNMQTGPIPGDHAVFHNCFNMIDGLPQTRPDDPFRWPMNGLTAIYSNNRMVAMMSLSGLQCGWSGIGGSQVHSTNCMKMMINIYFYAITH
jgi:hypothetical protein